MIRLKRAYDAAAPGDGTRFLVERLWPRGVNRAALKLDGWLKDVAPGPALRTWYRHDVAKWPEFRRRYLAELKANAEALRPLIAAARKGRVTFVYASRDEEHNSAVVLKAFVERALRFSAPRASPPRRSSRRRTRG